MELYVTLILPQLNCCLQGFVKVVGSPCQGHCQPDSQHHRRPHLVRTGGSGGGYGHQTRAAILGFFAAAAVAVGTGVAADPFRIIAFSGTTATVVAPETDC